MNQEREIVNLSNERTQVGPLTPGQRLEALRLALRVTQSPHEHTWTDEEAATMSHFIMWASQRLNAISQLVKSDDLKHSPPFGYSPEDIRSAGAAIDEDDATGALLGVLEELPDRGPVESTPRSTVEDGRRYPPPIDRAPEPYSLPGYENDVAAMRQILRSMPPLSIPPLTMDDRLPVPFDGPERILSNGAVFVGSCIRYPGDETLTDLATDSEGGDCEAVYCVKCGYAPFGCDCP